MQSDSSNQVPFLRALETEFAQVLDTSHAPSRRFRSPAIVAGLAFAATAAVAGLILATSTLFDVPSTTSGDGPTIPAPATIEFPPDEWGRVDLGVGIFDGVSLSSVTDWNNDFFAAGTDYTTPGRPSGVVYATFDGLLWREVARFDEVELRAIAGGPGGLIAVGTGRSGSAEREPGFAFAAQSSDGETWSASPLGTDEGPVWTDASVATAWGDGFIIGGARQASPADSFASQATLWVTGSGPEWTEVPLEQPGDPNTAINGLAVGHGRIVAVGWIEQPEGHRTAAGWMSADSIGWSRSQIPPEPVHGSTMLSATYGSGTFVAVGYEGTEGRSPAAWASDTGAAWHRVHDPDGVLAGAASATWPMPTRINSIAATDQGFVAVGLASEGAIATLVVWTATNDGQWRRFDFEDDQHPLPVALAHGVAAGAERVVVVGSATALGGGELMAAAWVGPPSSVGVSPLTERPGSRTPGDLTLTVRPTVATPGTRLNISGGAQADDGAMAHIWITNEAGEQTILCMATVTRSRFSCSVSISDALTEAPPGLYGIRVGEDPGAEAVVIEVRPIGSELALVSGSYTRTLGLLFSIRVTNYGEQPVDLAGWILSDSRTPESQFEIPIGTVLSSGSSFTLDFSAGHGGCPRSTPAYVHWCSIVGPTYTVHSESGHLWRGGDIELRDRDDTLHHRWNPRR